MIRKTTAFFIDLGMGMALMIVGAIILWHYSTDFSNTECLAILLLMLGACFAGVAVHQSDEIHRDTQKHLQEIEDQLKGEK